MLARLETVQKRVNKPFAFCHHVIEEGFSQIGKNLETFLTRLWLNEIAPENGKGGTYGKYRITIF